MSDNGSSLPEGRYGPAATRGSRRWRRWAYGLIALLAAGGAAFLGYSNLGTEPITAERVAFSEQSDNSMEITIRVTRNEPEQPAVCIVRVRDETGGEGGRKEVYVPPVSEDGGNDTVVTTTVRSARPPVTADSYACSYTVPEYLVPAEPERRNDGE
ncbi:DUF4307 domain-containing protein [Haloechinothrix sp. LS1_15]|uniref:DUF4307 domain-containing protein n=1 Tax=Haloechinothrix sp. LS1_15 TaxID=2652248 RepID=UPI0029443ADF|nr:DUF4307 domain-containing protein [Haloechinothrix sp. LS1_15]MDV6011518.1 DUF4307 domain-containing protein [Haloechinothrix sp. LS1_15]